jgi:8-oxo-dGTP diphosphatase
MIYKSIPKNFKPRFEIVSCYVEHDKEILLLHRHDHKSEGGKWGVPAGKIDKSENELEAMLREMREETGHKIIPHALKYLTKVYVRYPEYDFVYHMFKTELDERPKVILSETEHKAYQWISPAKALTLELVRDLDRCIKLFYKV